MTKNFITANMPTKFSPRNLKAPNSPYRPQQGDSASLGSHRSFSSLIWVVLLMGIIALYSLDKPYNRREHQAVQKVSPAESSSARSPVLRQRAETLPQSLELEQNDDDVDIDDGAMSMNTNDDLTWADPRGSSSSSWDDDDGSSSFDPEFDPSEEAPEDDDDQLGSRYGSFASESPEFSDSEDDDYGGGYSDEDDGLDSSSSFSGSSFE